MRLISAVLLLAVFVFLSFEQVQAQNLRITINPRLDSIQTKNSLFFQRSFLKTSLSYQADSDLRFYTEVFADGFLASTNRPEWYGFYQGSLGLQEAFVEYNQGPLFLKLGQQAVRWSDMWILPSLDIWTGRRWERFLIDPLDEQLTYPTGLLTTFAAESFSVDLFIPTRLAQSTYPTRIEQSNTSTKTSGDWGARTKLSLNEWNFGLIASQITASEKTKQTTQGGSLSYAFDEFVSKFEYLQTKLEDAREQTFAFGLDFFLGDLTIFPQMNAYSYSDTKTDLKFSGTNTYLNFRYAPEKHALEATVFQNETKSEIEISNESVRTQVKAGFWTLSYTYNYLPSFTVGIYHQNYSGKNEACFSEYKELTGGSLTGVRFEYKN